MTEDDPFLRDFGISSPDLHAQLVTLRERLARAEQERDASDHQTRLQRMSCSTTSLSLFLSEIPKFADQQLSNCQDLIAYDLDLVLEGSPALFIRPERTRIGRPATAGLIAAQRGWAAAYLQHLINGGLQVQEASRKAARDINATERRFPGARNDGRATARSVREWRSMCSGIGAKEGAMKATYDEILESVEALDMTHDEACRLILQKPDRERRRPQESN
ncbi:MAG: hypothetical protein P1U37_07790 [Minwuia sp.]|nr:hypothetical protein [Minwuia sp.]